MSSSHTSQNETNGVSSDDYQLLVATVQDSLSLLSLDSNVPIAAAADPLADGHNSDPATQPCILGTSCPEHGYILHPRTVSI